MAPVKEFFYLVCRINALEEQLETQKLSTGKQVEEEGLKYKVALVGFSPWEKMFFIKMGQIHCFCNTVALLFLFSPQTKLERENEDSLIALNKK